METPMVCIFILSWIIPVWNWFLSLSFADYGLAKGEAELGLVCTYQNSFVCTLSVREKVFSEQYIAGAVSACVVVVIADRFLLLDEKMDDEWWWCPKKILNFSQTNHRLLSLVATA